MSQVAADKTIAFVRHGRSKMNEYINGVDYGTPGFTDVFPVELRPDFHDSPLHPIGIRQAQSLSDQLADDPLCSSLDLVVVSPLTRAIETYTIGLHPHVSKTVPVLAHPDVAERLYMVSDLGKTRRELTNTYGQYDIDFESAFPVDQSIDDKWHWEPTQEEIENYQEWRPHGEGQVYACLGEIQMRFDQRMTRFYRWLEARPESTIAVVCHYGVIDWLTEGQKFENCEVRTIPFKDLSPRNLVDNVQQVC